MPCFSCAPGRLALVAALAATACGWVMFFVTVVYTSLYTSASFRMNGYEWIPGTLVMVALCGFVGVPTLMRPSLADEYDRNVHERAINMRIGWVVLFTVAGGALGGVFAVINWYAPPSCFHADTPPSGLKPVARLHSTPSPSPAPISAVTGTHCATNDTAGSLFLAHVALLCGAVLLMGLMATARPRNADGEDDGGGGIELTSLG